MSVAALADCLHGSASAASSAPSSCCWRLAGLAAACSCSVVDDARREPGSKPRSAPAFDAHGARLRDMALGIADPGHDQRGHRRRCRGRAALFATRRRGRRRARKADVAVTVYAADGTSVAWAGRPSELPSDRLQGGEAWFVAPGALGLRWSMCSRDGRTRIARRDGRRRAIAQRRATAGARRPAGHRRRRVPLADAARTASRIELPFEGAARPATPMRLRREAPSGDRLSRRASPPDDLADTRERWRPATRSLRCITLAIALLLLAGPLLDWRNRRAARPLVRAALSCSSSPASCAPACSRCASPADWSDAPIFSGAAYASRSRLAADLAVRLPADGAAAARSRRPAALRRRGMAPRIPGGAGVTASAPRTLPAFVVTQLAAGIASRPCCSAISALLRDTIANTTLDLLHFSLHPWNRRGSRSGAGRVCSLACHGARARVLLIRAARAWWRVPRRDQRLRSLTVVCWLLPLARLAGSRAAADDAQSAALLAAIAAVVLAPRCRPPRRPATGTARRRSD